MHEHSTNLSSEWYLQVIVQPTRYDLLTRIIEADRCYLLVLRTCTSTVSVQVHKQTSTYLEGAVECVDCSFLSDIPNLRKDIQEVLAMNTAKLKKTLPSSH